MVFTATIFIELVCGFSMTDIKPFYITILLQAINNMYDAGCSIAKKKQVFQVNLLQGITFLLIESKEYYAQFPFRVDFLGYWEFTIDNDWDYEEKSVNNNLLW